MRLSASLGEQQQDLHYFSQRIEIVPSRTQYHTKIVHMVMPLLLASGSEIRRQMLEQANVILQVELPRVDEDLIKQALLAEGSAPRDIADALADAKARKIATKNLGSMVLGCDQVLEFDKTPVSKPATPDDLMHQLQLMRGKSHKLLSAAVIYDQAEPVWRHVAVVRLQMRMVSDDYLSEYIERNWDSVRHAVGGYKLEEEGVRLFSQVQGDYFAVLGMPLLEVLNYLTLRGALKS